MWRSGVCVQCDVWGWVILQISVLRVKVANMMRDIILRHALGIML